LGERKDDGLGLIRRDGRTQIIGVWLVGRDTVGDSYR
jgi:hypothetical protein